MSNTKKYWKGIEELQETPEFLNLKQNEFAEELPVDEFLGNDSVGTTQTNRRDFLKVLGFSVTAASLAACEAPVRKAIPYLNKPEEITPGVANYYASTYWDGQDFGGIVVKAREGRPIKVDGNELCPVSMGGSSARMQASVLSLYDSARLRNPMKGGKDSDWASIDTEVKGKLAAIAAAGGAIRILSSSIISPSMKAALAEFTVKYPGTQVLSYDAVSQKAIADAHLASHGKAMIPTYNFDKADVVVGIGCDFLANWISPVEHARQYAAKRKVSKANMNMSRHIQIESLLTVTGSNADKRIALKPSQLASAAVALYNKLTGAGLSAKGTDKDSELAKVASELTKAGSGKALVVCGINDPNVQMVVNAINMHLGSYGSTINKDIEDFTRQGNDAAVQALISEMSSRKVGALIIAGVNPVYSLPNGEAFKSALASVDLTVSLSDIADETASACKIIAPSHHYLESWNDVNPRTGYFALGQPVINPLGKTRHALESILVWTDNTTSAHDYIAKYWETSIYPANNTAVSGGFTAFWNKTLHDGVLPKLNQTADSVIAPSSTPADPAAIKTVTTIPASIPSAPATMERRSFSNQH
jgi:molybdopterin-containing oxidoreductase family iron-sulfur binding subunit